MFHRNWRQVALHVAIATGSAAHVSEAAAAETYSLVHAIGNHERVSAKGLSKADCEVRKKELKAIAEALGSYNEKAGKGSITCLPDSLMGG
jgi:hypothetical protein